MTDHKRGTILYVAMIAFSREKIAPSKKYSWVQIGKDTTTVYRGYKLYEHAFKFAKGKNIHELICD
jgi:hypothetical protein